MQDNTRPYTNGTIIHSGPVQIVATEYKEKTPEPQKQKESTPELKEIVPISKDVTPDKEIVPASKDITPDPKIEQKDESIELIEKETAQIRKESTPEKEIILLTEKENESDIDKQNDTGIDKDIASMEQMNNSIEGTKDLDKEINSMKDEINKDDNRELETSLFEEISMNDQIENQIQMDTEMDANKEEDFGMKSAEFLNEERKGKEAVSTEDLLEEAIKDLSEEDIVRDQDNQSVKVRCRTYQQHGF